MTGLHCQARVRYVGPIECRRNHLTTSTSVTLAAIAVVRWLTFGIALVWLVPLFARVRQPVLTKTDGTYAEP